MIFFCRIICLLIFDLRVGVFVFVFFCEWEFLLLHRDLLLTAGHLSDRSEFEHDKVMPFNGEVKGSSCIPSHYKGW